MIASITLEIVIDYEVDLLATCCIAIRDDIGVSSNILVERHVDQPGPDLWGDQIVQILYHEDFQALWALYWEHRKIP